MDPFPIDLKPILDPFSIHLDSLLICLIRWPAAENFDQARSREKEKAFMAQAKVSI